MSTLGMEPVGLHCNHSELLPAQLEDQCPNPSTSFHASLQKRHLHSTISGLSIVGGCLSVHVLFPRFFFNKTHDFMLLFMQYLHPMHSDLIIFHCEFDEKKTAVQYLSNVLNSLDSQLVLSLNQLKSLLFNQRLPWRPLSTFRLSFIVRQLTKHSVKALHPGAVLGGLSGLHGHCSQPLHL